MMSSMQQVPWTEGSWRNVPEAVTHDGSDLLVTCMEGSDAWRHTSYGFTRDSAHALLRPLPTGTAVEVDFVLDYTERFDQAGVWVHIADDHWVKAGVEVSDGEPQVGAVVTATNSDWSVAPVPGWINKPVTVRISRSGDAVTVRASVDGEHSRLVRLLPVPAAATTWAGPYCASPSRGGLTVRFTGWRVGPADLALHD